MLRDHDCDMRKTRTPFKGPLNVGEDGNVCVACGRKFKSFAGVSIHLNHCYNFKVGRHIPNMKPTCGKPSQ